MTHDPETVAKTVLITGGARRIGRGLSLGLARRGWSVGIHYNRSEDQARELADEILAAGGKAVPLRADLARGKDIEALVLSAAKRLGPLGCLINNASVFENDTVDTVTRDGWDAHMDVNLRAPMVLSQVYAAQLPGERCGNIINIIDQRVWNLTPYFMSYTVSKSGLWTLTRTLAMALAPRIRVNAIGPGPTLPSKHQTEDQFERQCRRTPLGRGSTPEEICDAACFLLDAPAVTGQMLALDGGQHLGWAQPGPDQLSVE
ncbi:MAG: SDR family oxidoreductase [Pseudomonadota bacterium]